MQLDEEQNQLIFADLLASGFRQYRYMGEFQASSGVSILEHGQYFEQVGVPIEREFLSCFALVLGEKVHELEICILLFWATASKNSAPCYPWTQHVGRTRRG